MTIYETNQQLFEDLKQVSHDAEALVKATAGEAGEKAKSIRNRLSTALDMAKTACERFGDEVQGQAEQAARRTDRLVRQNPYTIIGVVFGAALLFGMLARRR